MNERVKVRRHYLLQIMAVLCNVFAVLTVIVAIGAVGFLLADMGNIVSPLRERDVNGHFAAMVATLVAGCFFAFSFAVMAQLIRLALAVNDNLRLVSEQLERQNKLIETPPQPRTPSTAAPKQPTPVVKSRISE